MTDLDAWRDQAAGRGAPLRWFFPERGEPTNTAKALCAECDVTDECLAAALEPSDWVVHGIWAGTSGRTRRRMKRTQYQPIEQERSA